jgi:peptidoglycan/LPS O-acetylase OafA/YrhL
VSGTKYRPDIDGLRALAVLPVILFHADFMVFSGGFVGVDVFFVISGYLITAILYREVQAGTYTLAGFYDRRIRRILPALFFMLAVTLIAGLFILLPRELAELGQSSIATALFSSNIFFYLQSGYFDAAASTKPLLHTWSLAVEEQYYIFFPVALYLIHRWFPRFVVTAMVAGALISLVLSIALLDRAQSATFYMLPTRAWELFAGGLVTLIAWRPAAGRNAIAFVGLGMILVAIFGYDEAMPFPGAAALLPVVGSAAIIFAGEGTLVGRMLALGPLRGIGLISYSLYLWHWPVIVYARFLYGPELRTGAAIICLAVSFGMAWLSWSYVERPFRRSHGAGHSPRKSLIAGGASIAIACGISLLLLSGLPARLPAQAITVAAAAPIPGAPLPHCFAQPGSKPTIGDCLDNVPGRATVVLWGDSHALQFLDALQTVAEPRQMSVRLAGRASCMPLVDVRFTRGDREDPDCAAFNAMVLERIATDPQIRTVVLSGRWARLNFPVMHDEAQQLLAPLGQASPEAPKLFRNSLLAVIDRLRVNGKRVILIGDVPEFEQPLPSCLARSIWMPWLGRRCDHRPLTLPGSASDRVIESIAAARPGLVLVRPGDALCSGRDCIRLIGNQPVSADEDHLSEAGAAWVVRKLRVGDLL